MRENLTIVGNKIISRKETNEASNRTPGIADVVSMEHNTRSMLDNTVRFEQMFAVIE